ncbi:MAG TPA: MlaD family protein [Solirubrobacteraceae bacterium]|jgi:phospholipid/cholesterol/gamma-HCH transport system substrate-binding protein|nr:MlaD family protein [Solirubrobacteraceae bacterium]
MTRQKAVLRLRLFGIAAFTAVAAAVFIYFLSLSGVDLLPHSTYTFRAYAPQVVELADHADVLEAGVKVGSVQGIRLSGDRALLTLSLGAQYGPVYRDGQIAIRAKTLLGENYVDLDPGDPSTGRLPADGLLPAQAPEATQLDQILSTLDSTHRREVQQILDVLAPGVGGHGAALNRFLGASGQLVENALPVTTVLSADREQVGSLIDDFGAVTSSLGERASAIRTLASSALILGRAVAARDAALRGTLHTLPGFVTQAQRAVTHLGTFATTATPVMRNLRIASTALVPAVRELNPAAAEGTAVVRELGPFVSAATATGAALKRAGPVATALAGPLQAVLRQADPLIAYLAPYKTESGTIFSSMYGAASYKDSTANYGRTGTVLSANVLSGISPTVQNLLQSLTKIGAISLIDHIKENPYPKPLADDHALVPFTGAYPHIEPDPPYERVK